MSDDSLPSEAEMRLLSLVVSELSGREVAKEYERLMGREISYGTLYTTFRRLKESGWVNVRDSEEEDGRVRYFSITGAGKRVLNRARQHHKSLAEFGLPGLKPSFV